MPLNQAPDRKDWGELGPAMQALNERQRSFVEHYLRLAPARGAQTDAARRAGYRGSTKLNMARIASHLMRDPKIVAAIAEEAKKIIRGGSADAAKALMALVQDPKHRDHARAIDMVLARTDPEVSIHDVKVSHTVVDLDEEGLEELRALRQLGTAREKLVELFGPNGLDRLEALEARRADKAKVIDGEVINDARR